MHVRNKQTGKVEHMRYGPATDAVNAGTHEFVAGPTDPKPEEAKAANAVAIEEARKRVTKAEADLKAARSDADKARIEGELKAAKEDLAKLEA